MAATAKGTNTEGTQVMTPDERELLLLVASAVVLASRTGYMQVIDTERITHLINRVHDSAAKEPTP
jgi:hypothetical protein